MWALVSATVVYAAEPGTLGTAQRNPKMGPPLWVVCRCLFYLCVSLFLSFLFFWGVLLVFVSCLFLLLFFPVVSIMYVFLACFCVCLCVCLGEGGGYSK